MPHRQIDLRVNCLFRSFVFAFALQGNAYAIAQDSHLQLFAADQTNLRAVYNHETGNYGYVAGLPPIEAVPEVGNSKPDSLIGIIDSGVVSHHPFIRRVLWAQRDFTGEGPEDEIGHGTVVTMRFFEGQQIARRQQREMKNAPIKPTGIISAKVIARDPRRRTDLSTMDEALRWVASQGAKIVNISAGQYIDCVNARSKEARAAEDWQLCDTLSICQSVSSLDVIVFAAVGNTAGRTACPACCSGAIAVGMLRPDGSRFPEGAFVDIYAPGATKIGPEPN